MASRRRRGKTVAIVMAGLFIVILLLEMVAIFAPAILGYERTHRDIKLVFYVPRERLQSLETLAPEVAKRVGARSYTVKALDTGNASVMAIVAYVRGEPVAVLMAPGGVGAESLAATLSKLIEYGMGLPSNETAFYLGGDKVYRIQRNTTYIVTLLQQFFTRIAALQANQTAAKAHGG